MPASTPTPPFSLRTAPALTGAEIDGVGRLVSAAEASDGGEPLAEDARLALARGAHPGGTVLHLLATEDEAPGGGATGGGATGGGATDERAADAPLVGYAQVRSSPGRSTVELLVAPDARGAGIGAALAAAVRAAVPAPIAGDHGEVDAWSHGDHPGAARLARRHGMGRARELLRMQRPAGLDLPPAQLPEGVALRAFEPGRDDAGWLALNAAAFADHPEQGGWDAADLAERLREPWFEAAGLLLLVAADDEDRLLASHWTKVAEPGVGEVYVVAVAPGEQGRGLGRAVVLAGLHHLVGRGAGPLDLYVEGDNAAALHTYSRLGFVRVGADVTYRGQW